MSINATSSGTKTRELIPAGNYIARCYQMIEIGTITESYLGEAKTLRKVRIGWELPTETRVFSEDKGPQPLVISKEFTLSMHEKANLRKTLTSWRGAGFTETEAKKFDVSKLLGQPCMINIVHKPSKDGSKHYEEISSITPLPKGIVAPKAVNPKFMLSFDHFNSELFNALPEFLQEKIKGSVEYQHMMDPKVEVNKDREILNGEPTVGVTADDLPF